MEKEIVCLIFRPPVNPLDDFRLPLIKSLGALGHEAQVSYIKIIAKCLAESVFVVPLPKKTQGWLNDVNKAAITLTRLVEPKHKNNPPTNLNSLFPLVAQALKSGNVSSHQIPSKVSGALKTDLVSILKLVSQESKELSGKNAIAFYRFPQTFFEEISTDKTLYLEYQRKAIQAIAAVNNEQEHFGKPYDALIGHILTCLFWKDISKQKVQKIRLNQKPLSK
jgi:hypothetical protein